MEKGEPDVLPASIPRGIRNANSELVNLIINGAEIEVVDNQPDLFCDGCGEFDDCEYRD